MKSKTMHYVGVQGTPCDLITGDERRCVSADGITASAHIACTVEMTSVSTPCSYLFFIVLILLRSTSCIDKAQCQAQLCLFVMRVILLAEVLVDYDTYHCFDAAGYATGRKSALCSGHFHGSILDDLWHI